MNDQMQDQATATPVREQVDIAILGTGITASMLACALARQGLAVLVVGRRGDGRYPGETTIPYTSALLQLIADRYEVPEVGYLADAKELAAHAGASSGVQRVLGFTYHRPGREHSDGESLQFQVPKEHAESHLYRPDVDGYLLGAAQRYGAHLLEETVTQVDVSGDVARVLTADGGEHRARCVVDTSGRSSPLVDKLGLREEPTRLRHTSRSITAYMHGVRPYEECVAGTGGDRKFLPWSQGMLHHVFDGGWLWVVPFGESTGDGGPLCSVGLNVDDRAGVDAALPPEEQFRTLVDRFPALARQFADARTSGDWAVSDLPYSAEPMVGDRFCVVDESATDTDLLFSRRVTFAAELVYALARELLDAAANDDFSAARLAPVAALQQGIAERDDAWVRCAYTAFADFSLWNAVARVWLFGSMVAALTIEQRRKRFKRARDTGVLADIDGPGEGGWWYPLPSTYGALLATTMEACDAVRDGAQEPRAAAETIFAAMREVDFLPPVFDFADPDARCYRLSAGRQVRTLAWLLFKAPPEIKALAKK